MNFLAVRYLAAPFSEESVALLPAYASSHMRLRDVAVEVDITYCSCVSVVCSLPQFQNVKLKNRCSLHHLYEPAI
jgi:hypothetical protein